MSFLASFPGKTAIYVDIPAPSTKIILAGDQASRTSNPPSTCSSKTAYKSQSRTRHRALITDHGSAVTGSVQANLQLIHLINEIRGTKKDPEKAARRQRVEALLNRQEFSGKNRTFHLTSLANTFLLEPGLRIDLDLYALFCLTIPLNQLLLASTSLALDNNDWTNRAKIDCNAKRELDLSKAPYRVTTIQVFVLHPSFQPNNMPLVILDPAVRDRPAPAAASHWKLYFSDIENTGGLVDSEGNALSLPWQISRTDDEQLSLFALIVNSYSKLRHAFERSSLAPQFSDINHPLSLLWETMKRMIDLIFYVPPQVEAAGSIMIEVPTSAPSSAPSTEDSEACTPTASTSASSTHPMDVDSHAASLPSSSFAKSMPLTGSLASSSFSESVPSTDSLPTASSSFIRVPGLTMDSDDDSDDSDDSDEYPRPDRQAPLTAAEIEIAFSRASNGKLTGGERVESAMLLFGMAGSHLLPPGVDSA